MKDSTASLLCPGKELLPRFTKHQEAVAAVKERDRYAWITAYMYSYLHVAKNKARNLPGHLRQLENLAGGVCVCVGGGKDGEH